MFDQFACWTDGLPNTTVKVPCPWYLPWYDQGTCYWLIHYDLMCPFLPVVQSFFQNKTWLY